MWIPQNKCLCQVHSVSCRWCDGDILCVYLCLCVCVCVCVCVWRHLLCWKQKWFSVGCCHETLQVCNWDQNEGRVRRRVVRPTSVIGLTPELSLLRGVGSVEGCRSCCAVSRCSSYDFPLDLNRQLMLPLRVLVTTFYSTDLSSVMTQRFSY